MNKINKIIKIISGILLVVLIIFGINYFSTEKWIKEYNEGNFGDNNLAIAGFTQPYVKPYNKGNAYYQKEEYDNAIEEYNKALKSKPPINKECLIRINLALAMVTPLNFDELTDENKEDYIKVLKDAVSELEENEVYKKNDDAATLREEILQKIDELENQSQQSEDDEKQDEQKKSESESKSDSNESEREKQKKKLQESQNDALTERQRNMQELDQLHDYESYDGKCW